MASMSHHELARDQRQQLDYLQSCREAITQARINGTPYAICNGRLWTSTLDSLHQEGFRSKYIKTPDISAAWIIDWHPPPASSSSASSSSSLSSSSAQIVYSARPGWIAPRPTSIVTTKDMLK